MVIATELEIRSAIGDIIRMQTDNQPLLANGLTVTPFKVPMSTARLWVNHFGIEHITDEEILEDPFDVILGHSQNSVIVRHNKYDPIKRGFAISESGRGITESFRWPPHYRVLFSLLTNKRPDPGWIEGYKIPTPVKLQKWVVLPLDVQKPSFIETQYSIAELVVARFAQASCEEDYRGVLSILQRIG